MLIKFEKKYRFTLIALAINIFYLIICLFFGNHSYFGTVDDYFMARILEGTFGDSYNVHMTFVNVIYGYLLMPLYFLFPKVGWYYIGEITEVFISFVVITTIILKRMGIRWGSFVSLLFILFFARDFYLSVQFTLCASALGAAGMLLFVYGFCAERKKKIILCGIVLILLGAVMRKSALLMGLPFLACAILVQAKECFRNKLILALSLLALGVCLCCAEQFNQAHYSSPEYQRYISFQSPRVALGDKANYDKNLVCDELEEKDFSCDDYRLLNSWTFYDTETFSIDTLRSIAGVINKYSYPMEWRAMPGAVLNWFDRSYEKPGFWAFVIFSLLLLLSRKRGGQYAWGSLLIMLALMGYLLYMQRLVYRVEAGLWLYATTLSIPFVSSLRPVPVRLFRAVVPFVFLIVVAVFAFSGTYVRSVNNGLLWNTARLSELSLPKYKALLDYIHSTPDSVVFFAGMGSYKLLNYYRNPSYLSEPIGSWKKIAPLGYWTPYFPDIEKHLRSVGVSNPIHDLVLDNVYVINEGELVDFLQNHYYDSVKVQIVREFDDIKVYKYSQVKDNAQD